MYRLKLTLLGLVSSLAVAWADPAPPTPAPALYKPTFLVLNDSWSAGTAFLITAPGFDHPLLLTCNHLFGPAAGLEKQMTPDEVAAIVRGAVALSMVDKQSILTAPHFLKLPDAQTLDENPSKDLALFVVDAPQTQATFTLANALPAKGERVWMYARLRGTDEPRLYPATVSDDGHPNFEYVFDDASLILNGTSGAPVLNAKGQVVGMNLGGGTSSDKKCFGIANPSPAILGEIASLPKPSEK